MTQPNHIETETNPTVIVVHPKCPMCGTQTELRSIEPLTAGQDRYTFRCLNCSAVVVEARVPL